MGSTGKTRKSSEGVTKDRGNPGSTGGGSGQGKSSSGNEVCMFSLNFKHPLPSGAHANLGDFASLVLVSTHQVVVVVGTTPIGAYTGSKKKLLINCIGKGFVYEGQVVKANNSYVEIKVVGHG